MLELQDLGLKQDEKAMQVEAKQLKLLKLLKLEYKIKYNVLLIR